MSENLTESVPVGIKVVIILITIVAIVTVVAGAFDVIVNIENTSTESNQFLVKQIQGMLLINWYFSIAYGIVLGILGIFLWKRKRWAKISIGVISVLGVLENLGGTILLNPISIIYLIAYFWIFVYLFFFKSAKKIF